MSQADRRVCRVDTLTSVSGCTHHIDTDIFLIDHYVHFLRFRHDRHGHCGSVDPAAAFRLGNTLHTMHAALIFQPGIRSLTRDHEHAFLKTADPILI